MVNSVVKIAVISDPQINLKDMNTDAKDLEILRECFRHINVDVVAVCGDVTENALLQEMNVFFDTFMR